MFWGLIMEPEKRYSQVVKRSFHISMAALVSNGSDKEPVQIMCGFEERNYLICTLQKDKVLQMPLDLNFERGDEISFAVSGNSHVHLTGYLNEDIMEDLEEEEDDEEVEEEEEAQQSNKKKRKAAVNGEPKKKLKTEVLLNQTLDSDDADDSDFEINADEDADQDVNEDAIEDEEEEDDDEEEDEEEEDDEDEEMEEETPSKGKLNGINKKKEQAVKSGKIEKKAKPTKAKIEEAPKSPKGQKKTVEGGVIVEDLKVGNGPVAKPGKSIQVYYEGRFQKNNKMFDSSTKGNGFKFRLGKQEVIKGWEVGIQGMKVGGKRKIICPPNMAYGVKGSPPTIPPNSTLVFEVELKNVH